MAESFQACLNKIFGGFFSAFGPTAVPTTPWEWCAKELHCNAANSVWTKEKKIVLLYFWDNWVKSFLSILISISLGLLRRSQKLLLVLMFIQI